MAAGRFIPACAGNGPRCAAGNHPPTVHPRVCGERLKCSAVLIAAIGSSPRVRGTGHGSRSQPGQWAVHPRVCGEREPASPPMPAPIGSSPRVRGTVPSDRLPGTGWRFIPACAGNGPTTTNAAPTWAVHPRVCGERRTFAKYLDAVNGSSPRVRGTDRGRIQRPAPARFIPACAGNGLFRQRRDPAAPVHPRVCGERSSVIVPRQPVAGSSPRVRGTVPVRWRRAGRSRFIPACAGNGAARSCPAARRAVHPRVCGERYEQERGITLRDGSSPRVRGTDWLPIPDIRVIRFIPACAGNGLERDFRTDRDPVHPRVCGERHVPRSRNCRPSGSSPRVRGTDRHTSRVQPLARFIPACAGNGTILLPNDPSPTVHPRVCGERELQGFTIRCRYGSSPRVRGTAMIALPRAPYWRFIPACAGNGS